MSRNLEHVLWILIDRPTTTRCAGSDRLFVESTVHAANTDPAAKHGSDHLGLCSIASHAAQALNLPAGRLADDPRARG